MTDLCSFYFPGVLVGPYLDYASYMSLIDESLFEGKRSPSSTRSIPDGRKRVAYRKMLTGLVFLGVFVGLSPSFYYGIVITPWFMTQGFLYRSVSMRSIESFSDLFGCRMAYFQFSGFIERSKYYAIWTLTEVGFAFCHIRGANRRPGCEYTDRIRVYWVWPFRRIHMGRCRQCQNPRDRAPFELQSSA